MAKFLLTGWLECDILASQMYLLGQNIWNVCVYCLGVSFQDRSIEQFHSCKQVLYIQRGAPVCYYTRLAFIAVWWLQSNILQIWIPFMRQSSNPTLEQTNKHITYIQNNTEYFIECETTCLLFKDFITRYMTCSA